MSYSTSTLERDRAEIPTFVDTPDILTFGPEYRGLRDYIIVEARSRGVPDEILYPALELWTEHYRGDPKSAAGAIKSIPIALLAAEVFNEELGEPTNEGDVVIGTMLHDCGKPLVGKSTLAISNRGEEDTTEDDDEVSLRRWDYAIDMPIMQPHAFYGAILVMFSDLPDRYKVSLAKVIAESHAKQKDGEYSGPYTYIEQLYYLFHEIMDEYHENKEDCTRLSFEERRERDSENIGDFTDAMLTRCTSVNSGLSPADCWLAIKTHIELVLNDYDDGWNLAQKVYDRIWSSYPENADQESAHHIGQLAMAA